MLGQWKKLDVSVAWGGIFVGLAILIVAIVAMPYQYGLAIAILVSSAGYLVARDLLETEQPVHAIAQAQTRQHMWLVRIVTGGVLMLSTLAVGVSYNSLGRPYWVILLLIAVAACILFQILTFSHLSRELEVLLLLQITFLMVAIVLSSVYAFPYSGGDTWNHMHSISAIVETGSVEGISGSYRNYPFYPALVAALAELLQCGLDSAARLLNLTGSLISLLAMYGLSRTCYSAKQSLILALLLIGSKWFVYWAVFVVSMITALWFFCLFVSIVLKRFSGTLEPQAVFTIVVFAIGIPFFHPMGAAAVVMLFGGFSFLDAIRSSKKDLQWHRSLIGLAVLVIVITLTQWMYYGTTFKSAIEELASTIAGFDQPQIGSTYRSATVYNLDQLSLYILYSLSGMSILRGLRLRKLSMDIYAGLVGLGFAVFGYLTQAFVIKVFIGHRWLLFASLLLVFPASSMLYSFARRASAVGKALMLGGIVVYLVLGLGSPETNRDRPLYGKDFAGLYEITHSEYAGLLYLQGLTGKYLNVDGSLCYYLRWYLPPDKLNCWKEADFTQVHGVFTFRNVYLDRRMLIGKELTSDDLAFRTEDGVMLLYDSGDLQVFERSSALISGSK